MFRFSCCVIRCIKHIFKICICFKYCSCSKRLWLDTRGRIFVFTEVPSQSYQQRSQTTMPSCCNPPAATARLSVGTRGEAWDGDRVPGPGLCWLTGDPFLSLVRLREHRSSGQGCGRGMNPSDVSLSEPQFSSEGKRRWEPYLLYKTDMRVERIV